jgi:hypothetical protein
MSKDSKEFPGKSSVSTIETAEKIRSVLFFTGTFNRAKEVVDGRIVDAVPLDKYGETIREQDANICPDLMKLENAHGQMVHFKRGVLLTPEELNDLHGTTE